jgi:hypothetical protein
VPFTGDTSVDPHARNRSVAGYAECVVPHPAAATSTTGTTYGVVVGSVLVGGTVVVGAVDGGAVVWVCDTVVSVARVVAETAFDVAANGGDVDEESAVVVEDPVDVGRTSSKLVAAVHPAASNNITASRAP